jgi:polysaccharide deacetylase family protein (PEP-CTERM system associated)
MNKITTHICTVQLQEYFQHKLFKRVIQSSHWSKLEGFVEEDLDKTLELLEAHSTRATFFTSGWIAEKHPDLLRRIDASGHELACIGYFDYSYNEVTAQEFITDVRRAKYIIEDAVGTSVFGYRAIQKPVVYNCDDFLAVLAQEGFRYDSSIYNPPVLIKGISKKNKRIHQDKQTGMWELPLPTIDFGPFHLPVGGGNALRQYPGIVKREFSIANAKGNSYILYFHPWELTDLQPKVSAFDSISRIRLYRNLGDVAENLEQLLSQGKFVSAREYLGIETESARREARNHIIISPDTHRCALQECSENKLTVVIPCYNESDTLQYLKNNLTSLENGFEGNLQLNYIFVDDKSSDDTVSKLHDIFGDSEGITIIQHATNRGVAGAIRTGIESAPTELVASIDADCSYDPLELISMINLLDENTAMVTASPYHKNGRVLGVPEWRLFLSRGLSSMYKLILKHKLATYTACFRVYRKSRIMDSLNSWGDFRGIVELLVRLDFAGQRIKEYPTTLHSRIFGFSKMKTLDTIFKHLALLRTIGSIKKEIHHTS